MRGSSSVLCRLSSAALAALLGVAPLAAEGLPGEFLVSGKWRAVGNESSPLTNPAFVLERSWLRARFTGSSLSGDYTMGDLGVSVPVGLHQTLGFSWLYQSAGEYDMKLFDEATLTETTVGSMEDRNHVFTFTYAVSPWRWIGAGANVNVVYNQFANDKETGVGVDAGLSLRFPAQKYLGRHVLGVAMQNAVAPVIGTAFARTLNIAWSGAYADRLVTSLVAFQLRDIGTGAAEGASGTEWALDTKIGVWPFRVASLYGLLGFAERGVDYYGGAVGVNLPIANRGRDLEAVYQYVGMHDGLAMHSIYVQGEFGWNREELHAKLEERRRSALPRQLFERALGLFDQGKYWEAFFTFTRIKADHPRFNRLDAVDYYAARCLEGLDMRQSALAAYELARRTYPGSGFMPEIVLGSARVAYRECNLAEVEKLYGELLEMPGPDSLQYEGQYLYAEMCMRSSQFDRARALFDGIPKEHPLYLFAQYSAAVSDLLLGFARETERRLLEVALAPAADEPSREIVDRANLKLGLLYLEELRDDPQSLPKAVTILRRVRTQSPSYTEARAALAWSALKVRNYPDCISVGRELLGIRSADPRLRAEGALVAGYALIETKEYIAALDVLEEGAALVDTYEESRPVPVSAVRSSYEGIAQSAVKLAYQKDSDERVKAVVALRRRQMDTKEQLDKAIRDADRAVSNADLRRRQQDLKTDVLYLLAEATKKAATERAVEYHQRMKLRAEQYDQKIEQLKQEVEGLK